LQDRHWVPACELLAGTPAETSISFSIGIALPKCGKGSADWGGNRLDRAAIGIAAASSGKGTTAPC
jgi:hypothetical protein